MSNLLEQASLVLIPSGYKEDVVYSEIPLDGSGDLQFTRSSNGTRVNSAGLVEVCPWNLVQNSENFDAVWTKYNGATVTTNAIVAPNGTTTADLLISGSSQEIYSANMPKPAEELFYTFSCYAKLYNTNVFKMTASDFSTSGVTASFNLSTLSATYVTGSTWSNTSASIESVGNGWYRCILTSKSPNTTGLYLSLYTSGTNSVSGVYIWGAQCNIGSTAKPYFPTTDRLNVPRLTYQNGGGGCPSLLLEKQSTNLVTYSEQINSTNYTLNNVTSSENSLTSPDGTINADKIIENTSNSSHSVNRVVALGGTVDNSAYSVSVFAKAEGRSQVLFYDNNQNVGGITYFNLSTGVVTSGTGKIENFGNGWYRCTIFCLKDLSTTANLQFFLLDSAGNYTYTGNGTSGIGLWGYQVEASSYPTSYIPTTSSSATRVADLAYKSSISSLFGASATSFFMDFEITQVSNDSTWTVTGYDGSNLFSLCQFSSASNYPRIVFDGGVDSTLANALSIGRHKIAVSFAANDFRAYIDGSLVLTDTSCTYNRYDRIAVNGTAWTGNTNNNNAFKLNEYAQFPTALTNAELASLTTI